MYLAVECTVCSDTAELCINIPQCDMICTQPCTHVAMQKCLFLVVFLHISACVDGTEIAVGAYMLYVGVLALYCTVYVGKIQMYGYFGCCV